MNYDLREVCANFALRGDYVIGMPFGTGHINDTNAVTCDQGGTSCSGSIRMSSGSRNSSWRTSSA